MKKPTARRALVAAAAALLTLLTPLASAQRATYTNPVIAGDFPDPSVVRVGEDYWAVATSGTWAPHFPIFHSRDLVNWRAVGHVFQTAPRWVKSDFWAPEIIHDRGRVLLFYTARRDDGPRKPGKLCVGVATAPRPAGPYTDRGPLVCEIPELKNVGSIDPFFVRDERGRPHLVWKADGNDAEPDQPTVIFAQPLSEDGTRLLGRRKEILRNDAPWERHVTEGSFILRRGEWFYHFYSGNACCGRECAYALGVARSRRLLGPWEKSPRNPIIDANDDWQCPGHGSIVSTPDGRDLLLYHAHQRRPGAFNVGREALLDEVTWGADGWPSVNAGRGPSSVAASPLGASVRNDKAEVFDDFNEAELNPRWQWPMFVRQSARVEKRSGVLVLTPVSNPKGDAVAAAVLARPTASASYTAETRVNVREMKSGASAGLAAYSWRDAAVGITYGAGVLTVWRREGREHQMVMSRGARAASAIFLRMTAEGGESFRFAFSDDGRVWVELDGSVSGGHVEGARLALTASGGAARFDWLRVKNVGQ